MLNFYTQQFSIHISHPLTNTKAPGSYRDSPSVPSASISPKSSCNRLLFFNSIDVLYITVLFRTHASAPTVFPLKMILDAQQVG